MRPSAKQSVLGLIVGFAWIIQGCGGGGGGTAAAGSAPSSQTLSHVGSLISGQGPAEVGATFATFGHGLPIPHKATPGGPVYVSQLGLWMVVTVQATTFTETFYQDKAETEPAGSATYTLDISTETLSGTISITAGPYAGLTGTYSQTLTKNGTTGTYAFTLPNGTSVSCTFTVVISPSGIPSGTGTETVTLTSGYSETGNIVYNANGTKVVTLSDNNGYSAILKFNSDWSGTGTISGPDPGLPATVVWNSAGTGTVTFANFLVVHFTNWQFPNQ